MFWLVKAQFITMTDIHTTSQYAVGWFTLALINAGLAQAKGRSGLNWWLVSLLLGPLATFFIVVLDPLNRQIAG